MQTKRRTAGLQTWVAGGSRHRCPSSRDVPLPRKSGCRPRSSDGMVKMVPRVAACEARVGVAGHWKPSSSYGNRIELLVCV